MIYMVEAALTTEQSEDDWKRWYGDMKPTPLLLSVPGLFTAQRFKCSNIVPPAYLAVYSVESAETMSSEAYRNAGGGRFLTDKWMPIISLWHRDLFAGADRAQAIPLSSQLLIWDCPEPQQPAHGLAFQWLKSVGLDSSTPYRGLATITSVQSKQLDIGTLQGMRIFRPLMPQATKDNPNPA